MVLVCTMVDCAVRERMPACSYTAVNPFAHVNSRTTVGAGHIPED